MSKLTSGLLYLSVILTTVFLTYRAERADRKSRSKNTKCILLLFFAVLVPCILAGLRSETVGTDTAGYAKNIWKYANNSSSLRQLFIIDRTYTEKGYQVFAFLLSRLFKDFGWFLFFTEVAIIVPFTIAIYKLRKDCSLWISMLSFMFIYYHVSLNMMRQSIAMTILLLAFVYLIENKYIISSLLAIIGIGFHRFSIVMYVLIVVIWLLRRMYEKRNRRVSIAIIAVIMAAFSGNALNLVLGRLSGGFAKYAKYIIGSEFQGVGLIEILTSPTFLLLLTLFVSCWIIYNNGKLEKKEYDSTISMLSLICVLARFTQAFSVAGNRVSYFLIPYLFVFAGRLHKAKYKINKRDRTIFLILMLFVYWLADCMLSRHTSTSIFSFRK